MEVFEYPLRTKEQHNTEWLYYQIIADCTGHKAYEIYENMALRILKVIDEDGDIGFIKPSSLNTYHHSLYLERLRCEAMEFNIFLPEPTKEIDMKFKVKKFKRHE